MRIGRLALLLPLLLTGAAAQQRRPLSGNFLPLTPARQPQEEDGFIKPGRPTVANPAEIQKAGVLQVEFGYDSNLRAE